MNLNAEIKKELKNKLFRLFARTAFLANAVGFMICFLLTGLKMPTVFCGVCCLIVLAFSIYGVQSKNINAASILIVVVAALIELPFLFYTYGPSLSPYLILSIAYIAVFLPKTLQWVMFGLVFVIDAISITLSYVVPSSWGHLTDETEMLNMLWAFCIVGITVFAVVQIITSQYATQRAQIIKMTEELELVAHHDQLTGLFNRRYMMDTLEKWMAMLEKDIVIVHIDLDDFKIINDTYGFVFGDSVLVEFARILQENVKDIGFASRYGGQEFVVMIDKAKKDEVLNVLEKIREEYNDFSAKEKNAKFTFSAGVVVDDKSLDLDEILATLDDKLLQAKKAGKNQVVV